MQTRTSTYRSVSKNNYTEELKEFKENVKGWFDYFHDNNERFHENMRAVCNSSLTATQLEVLKTMGKPPVEFEEREAYVNKQCGEFRKHTPGFEVRAASSVQEDELTPDLIATAEAIESHARFLISEEKTGSMDFKIFREMLLGGYSVARIFPKYIDEMSFEDEQEIDVEKEHFVTKCFFDVAALETHKGDGDFCGRIMAYKEDEAKDLFGDDVCEGMAFSTSMGNFNWSYLSYNKKFLVIAEYYKVEKKRVTIVKLSDGRRMKKSQYNKLKAIHDMEDDDYSLFPEIVYSRETTLEVIMCYKFSGAKMLEVYETDYRYLPLVFFDGSSVMLEATDGGDMHQMTRPYTHHLKGIQQLKNIAGQAIAYDMENMIAHKFMAHVDNIDPLYMDAWRNPQIPATLLYKTTSEGSDQEVPPPIQLTRPEIPSIVPQTFMDASKTMQEILGNYDQMMGTNSRDVSGKAVMQTAMQTAQGIAPYLQGYIDGLNRIGMIVLDLIPKYYKTPRTIPVIKADGKKGYQVINPKAKNPNAVFMDYDPRKLNISIKAGVNSEIQKQMALDQIVNLCKASPVFAQFINEEGLEILLDNLDIRNVDMLKLSAGEFMQKVKQMQAEAAKKPQLDPMQIKMQEIQMKGQLGQMDNAIEQEKLKLDNRELDLKTADLMIKATSAQSETETKSAQTKAQNIRSFVDLADHHESSKEKHFGRIERALMHKDKIHLEHKKLHSSEKMASQKSQGSSVASK